jgi:23S rRNA (cytosine1962-C5)-methyltransferase
MASVTIQRATLHPNIFRKRLLDIEGNPGAGDWVAVYRVEPEPTRRVFGAVDTDEIEAGGGEVGDSAKGGGGDTHEGGTGARPAPPRGASSSPRGNILGKTGWTKFGGASGARDRQPPQRSVGAQTQRTVGSEVNPNEPPSLFGYGIYNPKAEVAVRLYAWKSQLPDDAYWDGLVEDAVRLRSETLDLPSTTDAYRVVHGEADGFPGLVVDRYGDVLSAEAFSLGMYQRANAVLERLEKRMGTRHRRIQPSPQFLSQEGAVVSAEASMDLPEYTTIQENGVKYRVHFGTGHKTGFFCDQRDNRILLARHAKGCSVLDLCCYTGGFAVAAAKAGGAAEVTGVDLDEEALATAKKNGAINQTKVRFVHADAFAYMRDMIRNRKQFDIVVLDPPKLIRSRAELEEGTHKHFDLNRLALQLVRRGGLLLTCSCAGLLSAEAFQQIVQSAARSGGFDEHGKRIPGRTVQVLETRGASPDHPVAMHCPETGYLKAFWARVL